VSELDLLYSNANYAGYMYVETSAPPWDCQTMSAMCKAVDHKYHLCMSAAQPLPPCQATRVSLQASCPDSPHHPVKRYASDGPAGHGIAHVLLEMFTGGAEIFRGFLVEGIRGVRLEEKEL
jgi:hypothetical protein